MWHCVVILYRRVRVWTVCSQVGVTFDVIRKDVTDLPVASRWQDSVKKHLPLPLPQQTCNGSDNGMCLIRLCMHEMVNPFSLQLILHTDLLLRAPWWRVGQEDPRRQEVWVLWCQVKGDPGNGSMIWMTLSCSTLPKQQRQRIIIITSQCHHYRKSCFVQLNYHLSIYRTEKLSQKSKSLIPTNTDLIPQNILPPERTKSAGDIELLSMKKWTKPVILHNYQTKKSWKIVW